MNIQGLPHGRRSKPEAWIPTALALTQQALLQKSVLGLEIAVLLWSLFFFSSLCCH